MVISRRKKQKLRLLNSLKEKVVLNNNPGRIILTKFKFNKKDRRHSGRKYSYCFYPQRLLEKEGIFIDYYWDDWLDYRDGFRDVSRIRNYCCFCWDHHIQLCASCIAKIKKQINIRKARRMKRFINYKNMDLYGKTCS